MRSIRVILSSLALGLSMQGAPALAAPTSESSAVSTITKDFLNQARSITKANRALYKSIQSHPEVYDGVRDGIIDDRTAAVAQKEARAAELATAIQAKSNILATQLVLPHAVQFHQGMLALVADYKGQACAPGGNQQLCVGGDWSHRRGAMGNVIDSQASDVQALEAQNDELITRITNLVNELQDTSIDPSLFAFGFQHYVDNRKVQLEMLRKTVQDLAPLFDGLTLEGQSVTTYLPCIIGNQIPLRTFKEELLAVKAAAYQHQGDHEAWVEFMQTYGEYYEGNSSSPGILDHWAGCMDSKQLQINTLQAALAQALGEGNTALASIFDTNINQLQQDIRKLAAERRILILRKAQLSSILSSEAAQFDPDNLSNHAWVATADAHTENLLNGMLTYPTALRAMRAVLVDMISAFGALNGISDETTFRDTAAATAVKLATDQERGLERLAAELSFTGVTVLPNLASAIRIGESALTSNIDTYEGILSLHFQAVQAELAGLPSQLAQAVQNITLAQTNFANADQFVRDLDAALVSHDASVAAINAAAASLESLLGVGRFNPLFTDLANNYLSGLKTERAFKKSGVQIQSSIKKLLKTFDALGSSSSAIFKCKNRKGTCASGFVRKAVTRREKLASQLPALLDVLSRPYLGGHSIGEYSGIISQQNAQIMSRAH